MDVLSLSIWCAADLNFSLPGIRYVESVLHHNFPEAEEHRVKGNHCTGGSVKHHISLPLIFHVASGDYLQETEDVPGDKQGPAVNEIEAKFCLEVSFDE